MKPHHPTPWRMRPRLLHRSGRPSGLQILPRRREANGRRGRRGPCLGRSVVEVSRHGRRGIVIVSMRARMKRRCVAGRVRSRSSAPLRGTGALLLGLMTACAPNGGHRIRVASRPTPPPIAQRTLPPVHDENFQPLSGRTSVAFGSSSVTVVYVPSPDYENTQTRVSYSHAGKTLFDRSVSPDAP